MQAAAPMRGVPSGTMRATLLRPSLLVILFVAIALAGATLPRLAGYAPYGQQAMDQQIDREDGALCQKFQFILGTAQYNACKADLADLRLRHERLLVQ